MKEMLILKRRSYDWVQIIENYPLIASFLRENKEERKNHGKRRRNKF